MRIKSLYYYYYSPNGLCSIVHNFLVLHKIPLINIWQLVTILKLSLPDLCRHRWNLTMWCEGSHGSFPRRYKEFCSLSRLLIYDMCADEWSRFTICHYKKQANQFIIFREAGFNSPISFTIPTFVSFNLLCLSYLLQGVLLLGSQGLFFQTEYIVCRERRWQCWKFN